MFLPLIAFLIALIPVRAEAETHVVRSGAVTVEYFAAGRGPLLVLLPSMARGAEDFDEIVPALVARGFRVVRPQPRGAGRSSGPSGATLHDLADDIALVIRKERRGPAIIVGHAYGNFVARMAAADHPELVRGVIVAAGAAQSIPPELLAAVTGMSDMRRSQQERLGLLRLAMFAPGSDPSGWLNGWHPEAQRIARAAIEATPRAAWWPAGRAPILELQPAEDPFKPAAKRGELAAELGAARVTAVLIPNASHALFPEQPEAVAEAIAHWARSLPRTARR
jgi:pimeloyl-ACP methyl ester carboxylesterase